LLRQSSGGPATGHGRLQVGERRLYVTDVRSRPNPLLKSRNTALQLASARIDAVLEQLREERAALDVYIARLERITSRLANEFEILPAPKRPRRVREIIIRVLERQTRPVDIAELTARVRVLAPGCASGSVHGTIHRLYASGVVKRTGADRHYRYAISDGRLDEHALRSGSIAMQLPEGAKRKDVVMDSK